MGIFRACAGRYDASIAPQRVSEIGQYLSDLAFRFFPPSNGNVRVGRSMSDRPMFFLAGSPNRMHCRIRGRSGRYCEAR
jgi:hypothetical protein